jgi:hypothetical protein
MLLGALLATSCSARNCDNDALNAGLGGGAAGAGGTGAASQAGGEAGHAGHGGVGGLGGEGGVGGAPDDCDRDGIAEDLSSDADHCGVCYHACESFGCRSGSCVIADRDGLAPVGLALDDDQIFVVGTEGSSFTIFDVQKSGGPEDVWLPTPFSSAGILADSVRYRDRIYLSIVSLGLASAPDVPMPTLADVQQHDEFSESGYIDAETSVMCWSRGNAAPAAAMAPNGVRCMSDGVLLAPIDTVADEVTGVAVAGAHVYWTEADGDLWSALPDGAGAALIDTLPTAPAGPLAVLGSYAYVLAPGGIWKTPIGGGLGSWISTEPVIRGFDILVTAGAVYWSALGDQEPGIPGGLYRVDGDGGAVDHLYEIENESGGPRYPGFLLAEGNFVYFGALNENRVLRRHIQAPAFLP